MQSAQSSDNRGLAQQNGAAWARAYLGEIGTVDVVILRRHDHRCAHRDTMIAHVSAKKNRAPIRGGASAIFSGAVRARVGAGRGMNWRREPAEVSTSAMTRKRATRKPDIDLLLSDLWCHVRNGLLCPRATDLTEHASPRASARLAAPYRHWP